MAKLTDRGIKALRIEAGERMLADGNGLYLRLREGDAPKVWMFRFSLAGKAKKMQLGTYPLMSLADAREEANGLAAMVKQGIDPIEAKAAEVIRTQAEAKAKAAALAALDARLTVNGLFERWATVDLARRKDGGAEVRRMFEKDVLPVLGSLVVEDVRKGQITGVSDALLARGVPRMAKLIFSLMRQMFRFAVDRDIIEFDPSASIRKAKIGGKDVERDRVLSDEEIKALFVQMPSAVLSVSTAAAVWLALSTCCRIGELLGARWEHVDLNKRTWLIPASAAKNGKAHLVFLSEFAVRQFMALKEAAEINLKEAQKKEPEAKPIPWIFPNRTADGAVCSKTVTKQLGDRQRQGRKPMKGRAKAEISDTLTLVGGGWSPHDLRRTGATLMVSLGVLPEVAERCLNHIETNKVKRIYQRHSYEAEMRQAWEMLGDRLELLTSGVDNVVLFQRKA